MINVKDFFKKRNYYFFVKVKIFLLAFINNKITIRKIYNLFICNISYLLRSSKSGKAPVIVSVDLWNECNENCVFCRDASGNIYDLNPKSNNYIPKIKLDLIHYKNVVDAFYKDCMMMIPYVNGEPLMYKGIYQAIDYTTNKKLLSLIASNGILLNENNSKKLIESGLDFLKVHISGFTNNVHQIQHRKGNVDLILKNLKQFMILKKTYKANTIVMLDYILYEHNKHELDMARKFANENNLMFNIRAGNPKGMEDSEGKQRDTVFNSKKPCDWPWKALTLNNNRDMCPCCEFAIWSKPSPYGKIDEDTNLQNMWFGEDVKNFRNDHAKNGRTQIDICRNCDRQGIGFKF